ncbi:hypothetical protein Mgra_00003118 [Meloidogyne graminicola]|uniref:Uncharacterized protein n=1 Tax=Meloidogyne graminicola TaxID=189291 RepID=A0A8S9ZW59_9BILA|nr:hypothetical protein Mgra_00003118 [Meloidogyne graminicola]
MKRFSNETTGIFGSFIIPKKPKYEENTKTNSTKKLSSFSNHGKTAEATHKPTIETSTLRYRPIWTGSLRFGEQIVESIDLYPPMRECSKPSGFSSCLEMQQLTKFKDFINYWPIQELIKELNNNQSSSSSSLLKKRSIIVYSSEQQQQQKTTTTILPMNISYLYLINTFSPLFARICKEMIEKELVAFGLLNDYSLLFLIPNCHLSTQLGIPIREFPVLHCLFISTVTEFKSKYELYNFDSISCNPSSFDKFDGFNPRILAELNNYYKGCSLPINPKLLEPKQLDNIFTPNQLPPGGKPLTPYISTPGGYSQSCGHQGFSSCNYLPEKKYFKGSPPQLLTSPKNNNEFSSFSPTFESDNEERRQKNKAMFANAFEQIRNVGKTSTNKSNTELSFSSSKISSSILEEQSNNNQQKEHSDNLIIRDPRLLKHSKQQLIQNINKTTITTTTTINNNNNNISSIFKEKEEEEIKKEEFNNNETLTIKIVNKEEENSSLLLKPYSPSQVIISSSELMELEEGNDEKTIYPTLKEKEDFQQIETKIIEENKKEKSEHLNENISGINESGGEIPMDISE